MGLLAALAGVLAPRTLWGGSDRTPPIRVAAIQMTPVLGDLQANLAQAERLVVQAQRLGAEWIVLPEMFTSAAAFHPDILSTIQPLDGSPLQMMRRLARQGGSVIGGSYLAVRDGDVYNTFVLVFPDGSAVTHDKDQPTYWENCFYRGGRDDGVLATPIGNIGAALCWELIRSRTLRRMYDRVQMVLGSSCWWTLSDDIGADNPLRAANLKMLQDAPVHCARMLGVPVVHASHAGRFEGFFSPDLPDVPYASRYLGETMIVDAAGDVLVRLDAAQGADVAVADVRLADPPVLTMAIPEGFWIPPGMPVPWKDSWERWLVSGAHYYATVTKVYLQTGEIAEYVPEYLL